MTKIAIIGAGLTGLTLAHFISKKAKITLFEKSRGVGGRLTTRYAEDWQFDHGAPWFTARDKQFQEFLKPFIEQEVVTEYWPRLMTYAMNEKPYKRDLFEPHYIGIPKMNSFPKAMIGDVDICLNTKIEKIDKKAEQWTVNGELYDWVISTAPAPQTCTLFPKLFSNFSQLSSISFKPCFTAMIGFEKNQNFNFDMAFVKDSPLESIIVNHTRTGRETIAPSVILHSSNIWAQTHIDHNKEDVLTTLYAQFKDFFPDIRTPQHTAIHRWLYAIPEHIEDPFYFLIDETESLAAAGEWAVGGRVEGAFLSGYYLAQKINGLL